MSFDGLRPASGHRPSDVDVGWVEQRGTQQVQALRWVTLRCTQPTILGCPPLPKRSTKIYKDLLKSTQSSS
jgi:hypothetical protein